MLDCACASRSSEHCALRLRRYPSGGVKSFSKSLLTADLATAEGRLRENGYKLDNDSSFVLVASDRRSQHEDSLVTKRKRSQKLNLDTAQLGQAASASAEIYETTAVGALNKIGLLGYKDVTGSVVHSKKLHRRFAIAVLAPETSTDHERGSTASEMHAVIELVDVFAGASFSVADCQAAIDKEVEAGRITMVDWYTSAGSSPQLRYRLNAQYIADASVDGKIRKLERKGKSNAKFADFAVVARDAGAKKPLRKNQPVQYRDEATVILRHGRRAQNVTAMHVADQILAAQVQLQSTPTSVAHGDTTSAEYVRAHIAELVHLLSVTYAGQARGQVVEIEAARELARGSGSFQLLRDALRAVQKEHNLSDDHELLAVTTISARASNDGANADEEKAINHECVRSSAQLNDKMLNPVPSNDLDGKSAAKRQKLAELRLRDNKTGGDGDIFFLAVSAVVARMVAAMSRDAKYKPFTSHQDRIGDFIAPAVYDDRSLETMVYALVDPVPPVAPASNAVEQQEEVQAARAEIAKAQAETAEVQAQMQAARAETAKAQAETAEIQAQMYEQTKQQVPTCVASAAPLPFQDAVDGFDSEQNYPLPQAYVCTDDFVPMRYIEVADQVRGSRHLCVFHLVFSPAACLCLHICVSLSPPLHVSVSAADTAWRRLRPGQADDSYQNWSGPEIPVSSSGQVLFSGSAPVRCRTRCRVPRGLAAADLECHLAVLQGATPVFLHDSASDGGSYSSYR